MTWVFPALIVPTTHVQRRHARGGLRPLRCRPKRTLLVVRLTSSNWKRRLRKSGVMSTDPLWHSVETMFATPTC